MAVMILTGLVPTALPPPQESESTELLAKAADYYGRYRVRASGISIDEQYTLAQLVPGRTVMPVRFTSDLVLLNTADRLLALRDAYKVDNVPVRPATPRILELLSQPTSEKWQRAQAYAEEQQFRFLFDLIVALNDPTVALQFISREMQPKCTFTLEKREKLDGVAVTRVAFKETRTPGEKLALGTPHNADASGRFWIDPASGAILKTQLWATSTHESVVVTVTYAKDVTLDLWLPKKMTETYQWKESEGVLTNRTSRGYDERMSFQGDATYGAVRYTPVDLSKMTR
jgi:hypothetical protein